MIPMTVLVVGRGAADGSVKFEANRVRRHAADDLVDTPSIA